MKLVSIIYRLRCYIKNPWLCGWNGQRLIWKTSSKCEITVGGDGVLAVHLFSRNLTLISNDTLMLPDQLFGVSEVEVCCIDLRCIIASSELQVSADLLSECWVFVARLSFAPSPWHVRRQTGWNVIIAHMNVIARGFLLILPSSSPSLAHGSSAISLASEPHVVWPGPLAWHVLKRTSY